MQTIHEFSRDRCGRLLSTGTVGRVAFSTPTGPHIIPVNYTIVGESVLVRTTAHSVLGTYGHDTMVCFEMDQIDPENQRGWSVVVRGRSEMVCDASELAEIADGLPRPWAAGGRSLVLRIPWTEVTGRQLGSGWAPEDQLPVPRVV